MPRKFNRNTGAALDATKKRPEEVEPMTGLDSRLSRLVESEGCKCADSKEYQAELRDLILSTSGGRNLRLQSEVFRALSAEIRLKMMYALTARELCECEIMAALELTQPTASHHLSILERAGLVKKTRRGKWAYYQATEGGTREVLGSRGPAPANWPEMGHRLKPQVEGTD